MSVERYYQVNEYRSYVLVDHDYAILEEIFLHRGRKYLPTAMGGDDDFIADTAINLVFPADGSIKNLMEISPWDNSRSEGHKLDRTAHFYVTRRDDSGKETIVFSGWIVPYHPVKGMPMEYRDGNGAARGYSWTQYMKKGDDYLHRVGIEPINSKDSVEVGRLCKSVNTGWRNLMLPVFLGFRTAFKFLSEIGVDNYFCAAIDLPGKRYASLYEAGGMRKVQQYELETVAGIRLQDGGWSPTVRKLKYWAQHGNKPHTEARILEGDFGNPRISGAAMLSEKLLTFTAPYLFEGMPGDWEKSSSR